MKTPADKVEPTIKPETPAEPAKPADANGNKQSLRWMKTPRLLAVVTAIPLLFGQVDAAVAQATPAAAAEQAKPAATSAEEKPIADKPAPEKAASDKPPPPPAVETPAAKSPS